MRINTNTDVLVSLNFARINGQSVSLGTERISSGLRVNRGSDDPSGLAILKSMKAQSGGLRAANLNAQDSISYLQLRDAAMAEVGEMIKRLRDLAVRAANDATLTAEDRNRMSAEAGALVDNINNIDENTKFNGVNVFNRSFETVPGGLYQFVHPGQVFISVDLAAIAAASGGVVDIYGAWYDGAVAFPDFNLISPDGTEAFGYLYAAHENVPPGTVEAYMGGAGPQAVNRGNPDNFGLGTMDSADRIEYAGWAGYPGAGGWDEESFRVTNPAPGTWTIVIDNEQPLDKKYGIFFNEPAVAPIERDRSQIGPDNDEARFVVHLEEFQVTTTALGVSANFSTAANASASISALDAAFEKLNGHRNDDGARINRMKTIVNDNTNQIINLEASRSGIEDADMAKEFVSLTRAQVISAANTDAINKAINNIESILEYFNMTIGRS